MGWCMDTVGAEVYGSASYFFLLYLWILTRLTVCFSDFNSPGFWVVEGGGFQLHYCAASVLHELFGACDVSASIEYMPKSIKADL